MGLCPSHQEYGAQPPIEILRQFQDYKGWFGRDNVFRSIVDVQFLSACGPSGGGRNLVTDRYLRHFNLVVGHVTRCHFTQVTRVQSPTDDRA